ncbi:hypothetical protein EB796_000064 [Bugula neritina]|uniref:Uncharacterized protein n=1 Tax=Bugula neritina TaxID=10212 RepID=A0A7J7KTU2_BUGNE|nr:hypothetical protein EB796_000064 [Bugula neritina]
MDGLVIFDELNDEPKSESPISEKTTPLANKSDLDGRVKELEMRIQRRETKIDELRQQLEEEKEKTDRWRDRALKFSRNGDPIKALEDMKRKLSTQNDEMESLRRKYRKLGEKQMKEENDTMMVKWITALKKELADNNKRQGYSPKLTGFTHPKLIWEHLIEYLEYKH